MIGIIEIILSIIIFCIIWFIIFKIKLKIDEKMMLKDIEKKLEKQGKIIKTDLLEQIKNNRIPKQNTISNTPSLGKKVLPSADVPHLENKPSAVAEDKTSDGVLSNLKKKIVKIFGHKLTK